MGKIRINSIGGDEEATQKLEAEKRREAKKAAKAEEKTEEIKESEQPEAVESPKEKKKVQKKSNVVKERSPRYKDSLLQREKNKVYNVKEAISLLEKMKKAKFDETVELHINTNDKITGNITLPNGTGKKTRVAILAPSKDAKAADELLENIEAGKIDFDILVATPDAMPKLARVARILGPKGLMPNPKTGTVTPRPEEVAKKYEGGQMSYKTEAKANVLHVSIGKMSFGSEKLSQNINAFIDSLENGKVKSIYLKSTMSPSIKLK